MGKFFKIHCLFQISFISSFPKLLNFSLYWHLQAALVQDLQTARNDHCFCTANHSTSPGFSTWKHLLPWSLDGHGHCALPTQLGEKMILGMELLLVCATGSSFQLIKCTAKRTRGFPHGELGKAQLKQTKPKVNEAAQQKICIILL